jgi:glycosyltransferase involved in cell wall biosynthesis
MFMEDYAGTVPAPREPGFLAVSLFDFRSSMARKNPQGTIAAFRLAFGQDPSVRLLIKTQNGEHAPEALAQLRALAGDNVEIVDEVWPYDQIKALIASADVLVSLHRAEGFGLTLAEAMALGTAVIATEGSGNRDFMDNDCARLVPAGQIPVEDPQGIYQGQTWADPDVTVAADALRSLRDDPDLGPRLAVAARKRVATQLSPEAWFRTLPTGLQKAARHRA